MKELTVQDIQNQIVNLPNRPPAMLANHLAKIYGVETKRINEAVRRNHDRFPEDFCYRLTKEEREILPKSQNATLGYAFGGHLPWMFTRLGANQLSTVLKSPVAARRSVQIMRAFSALEDAAQEAADHQPEAPSALSAGMMTISKDEYISLQQRYIELQQDKIKLLELQYVKKPRRKGRPLTEEDKKEIIRLSLQGLSQSEIARRIGRSNATVCFLLKHAEV